MNKTNITRSIYGGLFRIRKNGPVIMVTLGVVGAVASTVLACKATTKLNGILEESKEEVDIIHNAVEHPESLPEKATYSENDMKKDLRILYIQTGVKIVKLYLPSVVLGTLSLSSILMAHRILNRRNVALAAAYATVDKGFKKYRSNVVERFGDKVDKELKYNIKAKEIEKKIIDENGEEQTVNETVDVAEIDEYSEYSKFFTDDNPYWQNDPEYNLMFLRRQEKYANDKLKAKGRLFLNEVYEMLGIPKTKAGQIVGWTYSKDHTDEDNYVDFGIYDINKPANKYFVNGWEKSIILDFNVAGNIWETM